MDLRYNIITKIQDFTFKDLKKLQYLLDERKRIKDLEDKYYDENTEL